MQIVLSKRVQSRARVRKMNGKVTQKRAPVPEESPRCNKGSKDMGPKGRPRHMCTPSVLWKGVCTRPTPFGRHDQHWTASIRHSRRVLLPLTFTSANAESRETKVWNRDSIAMSSWFIRYSGKSADNSETCIEGYRENRQRSP